MTHLKLKYIHGKRRYYFRRSGRKLIALPGLPGSAAFMDVYAAALAEIGASRSPPGSVHAAVAAYLGSMDFGRLAPATQRDPRLILDRLRERCGDNLFAGFSRQYVEKFLDEKRDTPFAARNFLKALKAVMAVALRLGLRADDPTQGICVKVPSRGGWRTWTEQDIVQFEAVYSIGTRARLD